jgi:tRNA-Thr(GGU) m(6)t(6)A37 methyltransferase TsaA
VDDQTYTLKPLGFVRSELKSRKGAPRQGRYGAPDAWIDLDPAYADALFRLAVGDEVILLTWLHQGDRSVLQVNPPVDPERRLHGVFATRSPDRPNPIGLHRVTILAIEGTRLHVSPLEAIDGTPIVDIKPVLTTLGDA